MTGSNLGIMGIILPLLCSLLILCPQGCSCQVLKFTDLPLQQWVKPSTRTQNSAQDEGYNSLDEDHPLANELLKVATCVLAGNPRKLMAKLPSDLQVLSILESGTGTSDIFLSSTDLQRFVELISLDIQGVEHEKKGGIILSSDTLLPLGMTLLYLNLERVTLTSQSLTNKTTANLVVKPVNTPSEEEANDSVTYTVTNHSSSRNGHRLIFLSQQNTGENEDKEILPYDVYKQEVEAEEDTVMGGLFTGLSVLTHLRVYDCAVKDISWHMFDGLYNLQHLSLEKNDLKFIPEFCFYGTPNLRSLSLAANKLLTLKSVDLAGLLMLEQLDLTGNNLTFLSELSLPPFPALITADFRDNPLDTIFPSTFEIMNTTTKLYLGGDDAPLTLHKNSLLGLRQLETLHLYNLNIPLLERFILQGMPSLLELKMRGNVTRIDFDAFLDLDKIIDLDLSHCHIQLISMDAFYGLKSVKRIDLSFNDLEFIPPGLFTIQQQKELREILLSKNRLTTLPGDFFKNLRPPKRQTQIQNLRLDGNPWDCNCGMIHWNPHLVNRVKENAPRCLTPEKLKNWGVFHALRKGGLQCRRPKRRHNHRLFRKVANYEDNNVIS
ncbi:carboxypeptidase N subunit 2 isoform X2 [Cephus cinctus]|uniref:Carboxypeptidase N subunit 2 isoform X2 n=1 Tax=Cephus cinctus TaxID=211228 RepID=A0AAJ7W4G1_CEPCN|nr:carboxypeptidase N subunit 2 isoform X2 [Cephus cinctus]